MDEPSMGLSPALVKRTFKLDQGIRDRGISCSWSSRTRAVALNIAEYPSVLSAGQLVLEERPTLARERPDRPSLGQR
jgi:ABC-type branched-subunit amino acid transport system ATPase component